MDYGDEKSRKFTEYCKDGKIKYVEKWIDNPNVDINWNGHEPLRYAIVKKHTDIVKLLLTKDRLETAYEHQQKKELTMSSYAKHLVLNPFTAAMSLANKGDYSMLNILIESKRFEAKRVPYLDFLVHLDDKDLIAYFLELPEFIDYIMSRDRSYAILLVPEAVRDIFLF